jgi:DNA-directed RNA polymerase subunit RPC12/RpoP
MPRDMEGDKPTSTPPLGDLLAWTERQRETGNVCSSCGSPFGPVYGHASITCALCGLRWRTRHMEQMDRLRRGLTP